MSDRRRASRETIQKRTTATKSKSRPQAESTTGHPVSVNKRAIREQPQSTRRKESTKCATRRRDFELSAAKNSSANIATAAFQTSDENCNQQPTAHRSRAFR